MQTKECEHSWKMVNVAGGLIVMKKCFHCGKVSTCFCFHHELPLEETREEEHFWNFVEADPAFHFDLECEKCGFSVRFDELVGLCKCVGCDDKCKVNDIRKQLEPQGSPVLIALGQRPMDERKQLPAEKIKILQTYFKQQQKRSNRKIKIVPHDMVRKIESCYAEPVKDVHMLSSLNKSTDE